MKPRLLLVEDEAALGRGLALNFELEGFQVEWVTTAAEARRAIAAGEHALVVLDRMLPDADGIELLEEMKRVDPRQPVLMLTARSSNEDRIGGLSLGADDYITKPFNLEELLLRVRGIVRRSAWYEPGEPREIALGDARLCPARSTLERAGEVKELTELEMKLLLHLWRKRGVWVARDEL